MANLITMLLVLVLSVIGNWADVESQTTQPLDPHVAQQYVSDSERADHGDAEAAFRLGQALESGRVGGFKSLSKALLFYKLAAENGHQKAAARIAQIEAEKAVVHSR